MAYPSTNQESHGVGFPKENVGPTPKKAGQIPEGAEKLGHLPGDSEPMPKPGGSGAFEGKVPRGFISNEGDAGITTRRADDKVRPAGGGD